MIQFLWSRRILIVSIWNSDTIKCAGTIGDEIKWNQHFCTTIGEMQANISVDYGRKTVTNHLISVCVCAIQFFSFSLVCPYWMYTFVKVAKQTKRIFGMPFKHWRRKTMTYLDRLGYYLIWEKRLHVQPMRMFRPRGLFWTNSCCFIVWVPTSMWCFPFSSFH